MGGVLDPNFPWKNWPYPEIPWKISNFPDPEISSSSSRRVFSSRLRALFKTMTIAYIPRKIAQRYDMGLPWGVEIPISHNKSYFCFIRSRQNHLSRHQAIISYFYRLPNRKFEKFPVPWVYLIPFPAILKPTFPISHIKSDKFRVAEKPCWAPLRCRYDCKILENRPQNRVFNVKAWVVYWKFLL